MKGIREAALTKDEPEIKKEKHLPFDSDRYDGSYYDQDYGYGGYRKQESLFNGSHKTKFKEKVDGQLKINLSIPNSQLKDAADEYHPSYTYQGLIDKAEILAIDEITKLAGQDWQKRYFHSIEDCTVSWDGVEVEILLNPLN